MAYERKSIGGFLQKGLSAISDPEGFKKATRSPSIEAAKLAQGSAGSASLQTPASIAPITSGETNKFAGDIGTAQSILDASKPSLGSVPEIPKEDLVSQALGAPNTQAAASGLQTTQNNPAFTKLGSNLTSGQGTVDMNGRRLYDIQGDQVTKFDAQGNPVRMGGTVSTLSSGPASTTAEPFQSQQPLQQPLVQQPRFKEGPSNYEMRLAAKNAAVGGSDMRAKAYYKQLLGEKQATDEYNKNILGAGTSLQGKQIEADAQRDIATQGRLGQEANTRAQVNAAQAKSMYEALKDKQEMAFKEAELAQKKSGQLGNLNLDLGKLNEMYDTSISKASAESPDSVVGLQQGRSASLITATGGNIEKAIKTDPTAMQILSSNEQPEIKLQKLKNLHPAYANFFLQNQG